MWRGQRMASTERRAATQSERPRRVFGRADVAPVAVHVCGNTKAILADFCTTEADALELDLQDPTSAWPTT